MRYFFFIFLLCVLFSCETAVEESVISLDEYQIEPGFELDLIAAEPLLKAPVAIDFDAKGRIWVVQMPGYMNDMQGSEEDKPTGSIVILEDLDNDGVADQVKTFLDSLVMPRALAHVYGGLLYAEPPFLYFSEIENDQPINRIIVDSIYAADGNPEHQPNGLLLNIDNWIYNAKSNFRYRRKNGIWIKEPTTYRGQWGIAHDNFGRLYYNNNSQQLLGDHVLPNRFIQNQNFTPKVVVNQKLTIDQRVYPLHATTVNRGYSPGVLNADSILVNTTAAAGLEVYRGGNFPEDYNQNVFVSIPEGNLIKRNILSFTGDSTIASQAWEGKEFLAATDEGFRPVSLKNGPDGSLFVVDMHRGMIGHHAYLSPYLKKKNETVRLDTLTEYGRILKVRSASAVEEVIPDFDALKGAELVQLLKHKNGWVRDRAQQYLIFKAEKQMIPELKEMALQTENEMGQIHALYTLEGLDGLSFEFLAEVAHTNADNAVATALVLLESFASEEKSNKAKTLFETLNAQNSSTIDLYLLTAMGSWLEVDYGAFFIPFIQVFNKHKNNPVHREAVLSSLRGNEENFVASIDLMSSFSEPKFKAQLAEIISNRREEKVNLIFSRKSLGEDNRTAGAKMFFQICASCHGSNGEGIDGLAPPLMKSEHVADAERLARIILHGLQGPVSVNGQQYEFNLAMPGLIRNENISDKDIADIVAYVTNAFSDEPESLKKEKVLELRKLLPQSGAEYTMEELMEFSTKKG